MWRTPLTGGQVHGHKRWGVDGAFNAFDDVEYIFYLLAFCRNVYLFHSICCRGVFFYINTLFIFQTYVCV